MKKFKLILLLVIITTASLLRIPLTAQGFFAFTFDQGRDLLAVKEIVVDHNLTLIGPTTGLPGIFYGPWWYYFLSAIFFSTGGNPVGMTLFFSVLGVLTIILLYWLVLKVTKNVVLALLSAALAAMSQNFLTASSQIWSPSLVITLMIIYVFSLHQIFKKPRAVYFFLLGLSCAAIADTGAAFGIMLSAATVILTLIFRKSFLNKLYIYFYIGILVILLPRIIFDLRHDFLISESIVKFIINPPVFQEHLNILERFTSRIELFYSNFAQTFSQSNLILGTFALAIISYCIIANNKSILKDRLAKFLILVLFFIYLGFVIYPDAVWDYYLAGMPIIFLLIFAICLNYTRLPNNLFLSIIIMLISINFHPKLLSPFSITWEGDGAIYKNQKQVLDYLQGQLQTPYSLYIYTPARFDYPFDYLVDYYWRRGKITLPEENQKIVYLIIRDDRDHSYLSSGWFGDKIRNQPSLIDKIEFPGDIIVEKHERKN